MVGPALLTKSLNADKGSLPFEVFVLAGALGASKPPEEVVVTNEA